MNFQPNNQKKADDSPTAAARKSACSSADSNLAYIGLGSNLGDKSANLRQALQLLSAEPQISVSKISSFYETAPVGFTEQDWFLNAAAELRTTLTPLELLHRLQAIENQLGRVRTIHWGPRTLDLDLLLYNSLSLATPELTLPHPRLAERAFVLIPLLEIAPAAQLPDKTLIKDLPLTPLTDQAVYRQRL